VSVVLIGAGFDAATTVHIGGLPLSGLVVANGETITGRSPSALGAGVHDVDVSEPGDSALLVSAFEVTEIESLAPEGSDPVEASAGSSKGGCATVPGRISGGFAFLMGLLALGRRRKE
jgi:uncharacterized protein (TIGR03382 family)